MPQNLEENIHDDSGRVEKEGAIYFEKVTDGMQQYENQIIRMNAFQAVDKFMEMWEMLGCKNMYVVSTILHCRSRHGSRSIRC